MKKFRFPLRSVETVRALREMKAREAFGEALRAQRQAQARLAAVQRDLIALEAALLEERRQAVHGADQVSFGHAHERSLQEQAQAAKAVQEASAVVDERRDAWVGARCDLLVITNLETKFRQEYRRAFEREEQALLDDRTSAVTGRPPLLMS